MINWLIKFLGGYTREEYRLLEKEYDSQREQVQILRAHKENLNQFLAEEKTENLRLQEMIFKRFGILPEESNPHPENEEELRPINTSRGRWSQVKAAMERDDRRRVESLIKDFKEKQA